MSSNIVELLLVYLAISMSSILLTPTVPLMAAAFPLHTPTHSINKFSYCLSICSRCDDGKPADKPHFAYLEIESLAKIEGEVSTTQILPGPYPIFYLNVTAVLFGNAFLPIDRHLFLPNVTSSAADGLVFYPSEPTTLFNVERFKVLRASATSLFWNKYGMIPVNESETGLDLCFAPGIQHLETFPKVEIHFYTDDKGTGERFELYNVFNYVPTIGSTESSSACSSFLLIEARPLWAAYSCCTAGCSSSSSSRQFLSPQISAD